MNDLQLLVNIFLKKMRKTIEFLLRGEKKGQSIESGEKKKETQKYLIRREIMKMLLIR